MGWALLGGCGLLYLQVLSQCLIWALVERSPSPWLRFPRFSFSIALWQIIEAQTVGSGSQQQSSY
ncbi:MAG: hypothetical protein RL585_2451 [Pseudomonadota bacterium]|jgi:hypothetical protein